MIVEIEVLEADEMRHFHLVLCLGVDLGKRCHGGLEFFLYPRRFGRRLDRDFDDELKLFADSP